MKIYFTSFSNLKTEITKQQTEYCNVTSLNPKTTEAGEKLCQYVGKRCCPKCSVDRLGWYMLLFFLITMLRKKDVGQHFWNRLRNVG